MTSFTVLAHGGSVCHWVSMCTVWPLHSRWLSTATNLHQILYWAWTSLCGKCLDDSEGRSCGQLWLAASSQQCACSCITSHAEFFGKISNHPGDSAPYSPDSASCDFWHFAKLKSPLKERIFQTIGEIQENMTGQLMVMGRTIWGPKVPTLKGTEGSLSCVQCFLYLVSSSINVSIFHTTWLDTY